MSEFLNRIAKLSAKQLMVLADELNTRVEKMGRAAGQPIAVIGVGCRFPGGADSPDLYWRLLSEGRDAIREVPAQRWDIERYFDPDPNRPGKMNTRWGGFLEGIDGFDAEFFGISPREAISMDPQQRLALEVAWETIENAGINPLSLAGSRTGVYLGICNADYSKLVMDQAVDAIDAYMATGSAHSIATGRISYLLDLEGPSLAVDTACSSSLVAVHLACQSLRAGECRMALAGGVNLILMPETTMALSKARMMSPRGRCHAFDQAADGFVRGEGCGLVALKRLADAQADGDPIQAVILGSAVNQDGRSGGITAPNGPSQVDVIRKALQSANLPPSAVGYIEAHGTGTILGDPIEMRALGEVFAPGRDPQRPLWVGSVKTNIGHGESAAGVAGLIKALLAVRFGEIPPHLHFNTPNVEIDWKNLPFRIPAQAVGWDEGDRPRVAGVSSFGFSGTNAHVVIGPAPQAGAAETVSAQPPRVIALSAREPKALAQWAGRYAEFLSGKPDLDLSVFSRSLNSGRGQLAERAAFVADSIADARAKLEEISRNGQPSGILRGPQPVKRPSQIVFMFTGQGSQYAGMGHGLYQSQPVFRSTLDQCAQLLQPLLDRFLLDLLFAAPENEGLLEQTIYAQPALFALEYALAALWRSWGIEPAAVVGHSVGEYVAACVAGLFTLEEGLRLIARRGQLMQRLAVEGRMAAVAAGPDQIQAIIESIGPGIGIAGLNGPRQTVVSGEPEAVDRLLQNLAAQGIGARALKVTRAFHSHLMEPVLSALEDEAGRIAFKEPRIPIAANLTGALAQPGLMTKAGYWRDHSRRPVRFAENLAALHGAGYRHFLEVGPHPVLGALGRECLEAKPVVWYHGPRRGQDDQREIMRCLGELYVHGATIQWRHVEQGNTRRVSLPTYPFQRRPYWLAAPSPRAAQELVLPAPAGHPLLGRELTSPALSDRVFEAYLNCDQPRFLRHHRIFGHWIMPTPAYLEMAMAAAEALGLHDPAEHKGWCVADVRVQEALMLPETGAARVQTVIRAASAGAARQCAFYSASTGSGSIVWRRHAVCDIRPGADLETPARMDLSALKARCAVEVSVEKYYQGVRSLGLDFGPAFQGLRRIWKGRGEALGEMALPEELEPGIENYRFHPALLDACFHLLGAAMPEEIPDQAFLLIGIGRIDLLRWPPKRFWNLTQLHPAGDGNGRSESLSGDITLLDETGDVIAVYRNLLLRKTSGEALAEAVRPKLEPQWLYRLDWIDHPLPDVDRPGFAADLAAPAELARHLSADLKRYGDESGLWVYGELLPELDRWCRDAIVRMLSLKQAEPAMTQWFVPADLARGLKILPRYERLFNRLCEVLADDGYLDKQAQRYRLAAGASSGATKGPQPQALLQRFPGCKAEIEMTVRCGEHLDEVLSGARDPLELLFPRAEVQTAEQIYENSPYARSYNAIIADAVAAEIGARHAAGQRVRLLEIGGGTGGTTTHVLNRLDQQQDQYVFSDISPLFVAKAQEKYLAYANIDYRVLDIEAEPTTQGFADNERFDIVIAANVLHATVNLKESLLRIRRLLNPGAMVILLEGTSPQRWVDLTFGLTEGWWRFTDTDLRPNYPLISRTQWKELLAACGLDCGVAGVEDPRWPVEIFNQAVIVARRPLGDKDAAGAQGSWILLSGAQGEDQALAGRLKAAGAKVLSATEPHGTSDDAAQRLKKMIARLGRDAENLRGVVYFAQGPKDGSKGPDDWVDADTTAVLALMQALCGDQGKAKLWICTRGGQAVTANDGRVAPEQAALWGLSRVFSLEHPEIFGGIVDLPAGGATDETARLLWAHIASQGDDDQAALRGGRRLVPRIAKGAGLATPDQPVAIRRDAAYLVSGGLGGLGLKIADWLAGQGAGRLILLSRKMVPPKAEWEQLPPGSEIAGVTRTLRALEAKGSEVHAVSVDVGDRSAMTALFDRLGFDTDRPLKGIIHAAVEMSGASIEQLTPEMVARMFRAKVGGARLLDELSRDLPLDFFVLFSSTTALWGVAGLGHYAAANQVLDLLAHQRRKAGLPAVSINWGTWEEMRVAGAADRERFQQAGLNPIPLDRALQLLGRLLLWPEPQVCAAAVDWQRLRSVYEARRSRPFFEKMGRPETVQLAAAAADAGSDLKKAFDAAARDRRADVLITHLRKCVQQVLRLESPDQAAADRGLFEMGMDSLMAVELKSLLERDTGLSLPSTLTFNYPSINDLAGYLAERMSFREHPAEAAPAAGSVSAAPVGSPPASDALTEDEISELLARKLQELK